MEHFPDGLPHGELEQVFPGVFFVTGSMKTELMGAHWHFSRNMTVVRDGDALTLVNTVRLDKQGLAQLDALGDVKNVVRIGALHGRDDAFYTGRYGAVYWTLPGIPNDNGVQADMRLTPNGDMPFAGCSVFAFEHTKLPEAILRIDREGGIVVSADALQNWIGPDAFFSDESRKTMSEMGFFQRANMGPVWMQVNAPKAADFVRLAEWPFRHALCGHGSPLRDVARDAYRERFTNTFGF